MRRTMLQLLWSFALSGSCFAVDSGIYGSEVPSTSLSRASQSEMTVMQTALDEPQPSSREEVLVRSNDTLWTHVFAASAARPSPAAHVPEEAGATQLHSIELHRHLEVNQHLLINAGAAALPEVHIASSLVSKVGTAQPISDAVFKRRMVEDAGARQLHISTAHGQLEGKQRFVINARAEALPEGPIDSPLGSYEGTDQSILEAVFVRRHAEDAVATGLHSSMPHGQLEPPVFAASVARPPVAARTPEGAGATQLHSSKPHGHLEGSQRFVINARAEALPEASMDFPSESKEGTNQSISDDVFVRRHDLQPILAAPQLASALALQAGSRPGVPTSWLEDIRALRDGLDVLRLFLIVVLFLLLLFVAVYGCWSFVGRNQGDATPIAGKTQSSRPSTPRPSVTELETPEKVSKKSSKSKLTVTRSKTVPNRPDVVSSKNTDHQHQAQLVVRRIASESTVGSTFHSDDFADALRRDSSDRNAMLPLGLRSQCSHTRSDSAGSPTRVRLTVGPVATGPSPRTRSCSPPTRPRQR